MERALSWNEDQCAEAMRRTSDVRLKQHRAGRAHTLDLSPTLESSPLTPGFNLEDTVFEVDEENAEKEGDPLLNHMNSKSSKHSNDDKHVKFQTSSEPSTITVSSKPTSTDGQRSTNQKLQSSQSEHHGGQLFRQDAMKDSDCSSVEMQDLGKSEEKKSEKKKSE